VDSSLYVGDLLYVPLRREWYYEVIITDIAVNDASLGLDCKEVSSFAPSVTYVLRYLAFAYCPLYADLLQWFNIVDCVTARTSSL